LSPKDRVGWTKKFSLNKRIHMYIGEIFYSTFKDLAAFEEKQTAS
jgi:hypothetical protein